MTKFAAIGTDGTRMVVWGLGDTEEAALVDAGLQEGVDGVDLTTRPVSATQAEEIERGVVDWGAIKALPADVTDEPTRIILDNGGGLVLQFGGWAHSYEYPTNRASAEAAAKEIREWLASGTTDGWEGNQIADFDLVSDAEASETDVVTIDRSVDTAESLATELRATEGAMAVALADALAMHAPDMAVACEWARSASAGDYLVEYEDTGMTAAEDPGSRCGYDDQQLDEIGRLLRERDLRLTADDCGLVAQARDPE